MTELIDRLLEVAHVPVLLVATDFDGTIAPIAERPETVDPDREAIVALRILSSLPHTHVGVISGRALADLSKRLDGGAGNLRLIGSHGSEFEAGFAEPLGDELVTRLARATKDLENVAARFQGAWVEKKPGSAALHYRSADAALHDGISSAALALVNSHSSLFVKLGKKVVELGVLKANKGEALATLRQRVSATAVVFCGDDGTDEDAFAVLTGPDIGIKVGTGETRAAYRVEDNAALSRVLVRLAEARAAWFAGARDVPIERHALLSDQRTTALVDPKGHVSWLCMPRLDASAIFAELLGGEAAGFFAIRGHDESRALAQRFVGDSFVVETEWRTFKVFDYLDAGAGRAYQRAGRTSLMRVIEGQGFATVTFAPRVDFGRIATRIAVVEGGLMIEGSLEPIVLLAPGVRFEVKNEGQHQTASATIELGPEPVVFELRYGTASLGVSQTVEPRRREQNLRFWEGWAGALDLPGEWKDEVKRSALVLKALSYGPSGAIAAAATTSLPESLGGVRNWDYRYCWPRDAAIAAHALVDVGVTGPGLKLLDWILSILDNAGPGAMIAPVYTVSGGHLGPEAELGHLSGYGGSRPVRVSNAAAHQLQLDVFGPIAAMIAALAEREAPLSGEHLRLVESMVDLVAARWREPDHGIWEIRAPRRHHVHSKVMCWWTVDRAIEISRYLGHERAAWRELRDEIRQDVLANGAPNGSFGASYEDPSVDAAALWVGLSGMLAPNDPRFVATVDEVDRVLRSGPGVHRYLVDDGLPGKEGAFLLCTTWLTESLALLGRVDAARELFTSFLALRGPTGLLAEEYDATTKRALGNYPQAYSHAGLIRVARRLARTTPA